MDARPKYTSEPVPAYSRISAARIDNDPRWSTRRLKVRDLAIEMCFRTAWSSWQISTAGNPRARAEASCAGARRPSPVPKTINCRDRPPRLPLQQSLSFLAPAQFVIGHRVAIRTQSTRFQIGNLHGAVGWCPIWVNGRLAGDLLPRILVTGIPTWNDDYVACGGNCSLRTKGDEHRNAAGRATPKRAAT